MVSYENRCASLYGQSSFRLIGAAVTYQQRQWCRR